MFLGLMAIAALAAGAPDWRSAVKAEDWNDATYNDETLVFWRPAPQPPGGQLRRIWIRYERKTPAAGGFLSVVSLLEVDCTKLNFRALQTTGYPSQNLSGAGASFYDVGEWHFAIPGTFDDASVAMACAKPGKP